MKYLKASNNGLLQKPLDMNDHYDITNSHLPESQKMLHQKKHFAQSIFDSSDNLDNTTLDRSNKNKIFNLKHIE